MPAAPIWVSCSGARELRTLSKRLRGEAHKGLRQEMRKQIKAAGKPVLEDVKRAALGVDVTSTRGGVARPDQETGLRAAVSRATTLSVTARGIRIRVSNTKLAKTHSPKLAKYLDASTGRYASWRHPVFGNRNNWAEQKGSPFFYVTIRPHLPEFRRACTQAMEDTAQRITKG